jgi:hypothetical protein
MNSRRLMSDTGLPPSRALPVMIPANDRRALGRHEALARYFGPAWSATAPGWLSKRTTQRFERPQLTFVAGNDRHS